MDNVSLLPRPLNLQTIFSNFMHNFLQATIGVTLIFRRDLITDRDHLQTTMKANDWVILATFIVTMLNIIITS